jgi:hypothetical protein
MNVLQESMPLLPLDETLAMIGMTNPNDEQVKMLTDGMEILVGVLGGVAMRMVVF